ncbi:uncharacterized protein BT62DRAFT_464262 [Guyanagaster necrorhizus]|uniref:Uncharacterized protein n=1 Tax=Guyanagaster necrorhizus TaxID=856835 RepID=A0A9P7VKU0_9AGAR|nr:uncharacterized protein BT62DRAFT_464262 [Guyanagaster necrorhizus MCA 3950]KAG7441806.1 hypothetical protein BT62DRAFT_464262 [Guyanagaster necrorhizus MCA 3950]
MEKKPFFFPCKRIFGKGKETGVLSLSSRAGCLIREHLPSCPDELCEVCSLSIYWGIGGGFLVTGREKRGFRGRTWFGSFFAQYITHNCVGGWLRVARFKNPSMHLVDLHPGLF